MRRGLAVPPRGLVPRRLFRSLPALGFLVMPLAATACSDEPSISDLPSRPAELEISLGAYDDPVLAFSRISGFTVDPEGRLYVLQAMEGTVTVLNPDGTLHRVFGRKGEGPGEFLSGMGMGWLGDTLWVRDMALQRFSFFHEGELLRTRGPVHVHREQGERIGTQWLMADGSYFTMLSWRFERPAGHPDNSLRIVRTTPDGESERVVARLREHFPFGLVIEFEGGYSSGSPFFQDFPLHSVSDVSERMAILDRPFGEGSQSPLHLTVLGASGDTIYSREYMVDVEPLTDDQWNEKLQAAWDRRPNRRYSFRDLENASRRPAHWSSATRLVMGADLSIWIALADLPWRDDRDWVAFSPEGEPLFKVGLPKDFGLLTASGDLLWGVWEDELDIQYVQRYRLGRSGGG